MKFLTILIALLLFQYSNAGCVAPPPPLNGTSFGCISEGGQYQFFCEEGYALIGPPSRLCVSSEWTGTEPRCDISLGGANSFADIRFDIEYGIIPSFYLQGTFYLTCYSEAITLEQASIGCRQTGSSGALAIHQVDLEFGLAIKGPYLFATNLSCVGNESHISHCSADAVGLKPSCDNGVLGVSCKPYIQVRYNTVLDRMQLLFGSWIDMCADGMQPQTADTYCRLEGKLGGGIITSVNGTRVGSKTISSVKCSKEMRNFGDCVVTVVDTECSYLKIECRDTNIENSLRLTGAEDLHTGKLQIYRESSWGDICYEAFYPNEAAAACKQLGFQEYLAYPRGVYGEREGDSYKVERVKCPPGAVNFSYCEFLTERRCDSPNDTVAIWCVNNKSCCLPEFNTTQLTINSTKTGEFTHGEVVRFSCRGNTVISGKSTLQCESGKWIGDIPTCILATEDSIRLISGPTSNEGSIQIFLKSKWNFVCDRNFTLETATKNCENLGYEGALEVTKFNFYNSTPEQPNSTLECNNGACDVSNCSTNEIAGIVCGDLQFEVKFVGSQHNHTSGRVQVFYDGIWAEICSDFGSFFTRNGQTVCAQLGYTYHSDYGYAEGQQKFGSPDSNVTISFLCYGNKDNIGSCAYSVNTCANSGLYLACTPPDNGTLRLVGSKTSSQGIVEVYKNFSWQSICLEDWDSADGSVVCRELGWGGVKSVNTSFGDAISKIGFAITQVVCFGNESSLMECQSVTDTNACKRDSPATVVCDTPAQYGVRLTQTIEFDKNTSGLVEVYVGTEWLGVCDDDWGLPDANVVCRYLGYDYTIEAIQSYYLIAANNGWNYVNCVGNETNLGECRYSNTTVASYFFASCYRTEGAGVTCGKYVDYDVRISPETLSISDTISGVVEIMIRKVWFQLCFTGNDVSPYFCSELGYGNATGVLTSRELTALHSINDFTCSDTGMSLSECMPTPDDASDCPSRQVVDINCVNLEGRLRLVDGNSTSGHVQVYFSNRWGDVCDDLWGIEDANVVCKQLGMKSALRAISYSAFGTRDYYFWLDNVKCVGTESRLVDCPSNGWAQHNCGRFELAGVQCLPSDCPLLSVPPNTLVNQNVTHGGYATFSCAGGYRLEGLKNLRCLWSEWTGEIPTCVIAKEGDIQLVDGPTSYEGHLQVFYNGQWGYVCDDSWGDAEGIVVCRQLGYAPNLRGISTSTFYPISSDVSVVWKDSIDCVGNESQLNECQGANWVVSQCGLKEVAGVQCYADEGSLRLYGGEEREFDFNGLLQIYENGTWHYFCNFEFIGGIGPACSQLGYQNTGHTYSHPVNTTDFKSAFCLFTDSYLYPNCEINDAPFCFQNFVVNLTCTINDRCLSRLTGNTYKGIVEFWRDGRWGGICKDGFTFREADVFCNQLGWTGGVASVGYDVTASGAIPFHFQSVSCDSSQTDICNCTKDINVNSTCIRDEAVYIECIVPADGSLRLVGGSTEASGTLEIFHEGYWGSVCDDSWNGLASTVACKQLGYRNFNAFSMRNTLTTDVWLDDVVCIGNEEYLSNCSNSGWGTHNCGSLEGVKLDCIPYADTELLLTDKQYTNDDVSARIQIRYGNSWYNICPYQITNAFANQLCRRFNFENSPQVSMSLEYDRPVGSSNDTLSLVGCPLEFVNLTQCIESVICPTNKVLGIKCRSLENQTRLITTNGFSGLIEINHAGIWRGICDDGWDLNDTIVACNQLGFEGAIRPLEGLVRDESSFWITNVNCGGYERYLDHCEFLSWEVTNCYRSEYAGVVCTPHNCTTLPTVPNGDFVGNTSHGSAIELVCDTNYTVIGTRNLECVNSDWIGVMPSCQLPQEFALQLVDFDEGDFHTGHIQIYHLDQWGYICDTNWDNTDGAVACSQLGFEGFQRITLQSYHNNTSGMYWTENVNCHDSDKSFAECGVTFNNSLNCYGNIAGVRCVNLEGHLKLINGTTNSSGWVRIYKQGRYYPVCYSTFGPEEVAVACRQLGYSRGERLKSGTPRVVNSELTVDCTGTENSISDCTEFELEGFNCYRIDAFINCSSEVEYTIRLVHGKYGYEGQLEVFLKNVWSSVCLSGMDLATVSGICYVLGWEYGAKNLSNGTALSHLGVQISIASCPSKPDNISICEINTDNINCTREEAASIECRTPPENTLRRGYNNALEIYHENRWGYICDDLFDHSDANVACRHLGYPGALSFKSRVNVLSDFFWLDNLLCTGFEFSLADCKANNFEFENCYASEGVSVECNPNYNGSITFKGEIPQIYLDNAFYYICADEDLFSINSAMVICNQEGLVVKSVGSTSLDYGFYSKDMRCIGTETNVTDCIYTQSGSCNTVATVECIDPTGLIRLVDGTETNGIIQIHNGSSWLYICPVRWSYGDAAIACNQLGFNTVREVSDTTDVTGSVVYYGTMFDCYGTESKLIDCSHIKTEMCDEAGVATLACEQLICPNFATINSCGSRCSDVCNDTSSMPSSCGCELKCECNSDYIWEERPHETCIHISNCPTYCTENESYKCVPACQYNCANYKMSQRTNCRLLACAMGCGCKDGYVRKSETAGECVLKADCEPRTTQATSSVTHTPTALLTNATTTLPTPVACPANSRYTDCGSLCPLNCSSIVPVPIMCTHHCNSGCVCDDGFVLLQGDCIEQTSCPLAGSVEIQRDTIQSGKISGPLRLFTNGNWYSICSDGIMSISNELYEFSCDHLNYTSLIEAYYETAYKPGLQTVRLECSNGALEVTQCNYTETDTCGAILNLACIEPPVISPIGVVATRIIVIIVIIVILALITLVGIFFFVIAVIVIIMIRRKNQAQSYNQFSTTFSVVSDATDPIDDPAGIANPMYQTKDLEAEQLIPDDDDA